MMSIPEKLNQSDNRLCIGIDPRVEMDQRLDFAMEIIEETNEYAVSYKPNIQFWHGSSSSEIKSITSKAHSYGIPVIADLKLSDIGSTNEWGMRNMAGLGFDYLTTSPFPGNIMETGEMGRKIGIGVITLIAMSNPQSEWTTRSGMFKTWAADAEMYSDGIVIGTTNHITPKILQVVADLVTSPFVLAPGIGKQGGSPSQLHQMFGDRVVFNVSRGISESGHYRKNAEYYSKMISEI